MKAVQDKERSLPAEPTEMPYKDAYNSRKKNARTVRLILLGSVLSVEFRADSALLQIQA